MTQHALHMALLLLTQYYQYREGRAIMGAGPHMSPPCCLVSGAEDPVVINVLLISILGLLRPALTRHAGAGSDSGLTGVRGRGGPAQFGADHRTIGVSESVGQRKPESPDTAWHCHHSRGDRGTSHCRHITAQTPGNKGLNVFELSKSSHLRCAGDNVESLMLKHLFLYRCKNFAEQINKLRMAIYKGMMAGKLGQIICSSAPAWQPVQPLVNFDKIALSLLVESLDQTDR